MKVFHESSVRVKNDTKIDHEKGLSNYFVECQILNANVVQDHIVQCLWCTRTVVITVHKKICIAYKHDWIDLLQALMLVYLFYSLVSWFCPFLAVYLILLFTYVTVIFTQNPIIIFDTFISQKWIRNPKR